MSEADERLRNLIDAVLSGKVDDTRQSTYAALAQGRTVNEVLDALVEAVSILVDLHEVGEYDQSRLAPAESAVSSCLQAVEDRLATTEGKFGCKATVGPVGLKAGGLLASALAAVLRSVGFHATQLGKTQTALELLRNSEELRADLVIPLLPGDAVEQQLQALIEEVERGGFRGKFEIIILAPGFRETISSRISVARNSSEAISKATEWALKKRAAS